MSPSMDAAKRGSGQQITAQAQARAREYADWPICPSCAEPIDPAITRAGLGIHPTCDPIDVDPDILTTQLFTLIATAIDDQPRSQQTRIGPSELGTPCDRRLGYKMAGIAEVNHKGGTPWKPYVGTAIHEQLSNVMAKHEVDRFADPDATPRWHVEERVNVGEVNGVPITGSCDLFDAHSGTVVDWKTTSWNKIREDFRPHGPGEQYRTQAHLYGRGWQRAGHAVSTVCVIWLVRDGSFDQRYVWHEPYDEQVALDALDRASSIALALDALGPDFTIPTLPTGDAYCTYCPWFSKGSSTPATACPGHPTTRALKTPDTSGPAFGTVTPPIKETAA